MAYFPDWRIPLPPQARFLSSKDIPDHASYEELHYDYNTMQYRTRSQQLEINSLKEQLEAKKKDEREKVKSIIGYFFKRR
jgi:hypothetical protein